MWVRMWICGIMTFHIEYTMYIVYCACIFGLEAIINGKRSESQSVTYSYKYFCIEWQKCSNSNIRNNQMKLTWIYVCVIGQRYWLLEFENLLSIWFLSPRLTFTRRQLNHWSESESHPCYTKRLKPSWQPIISWTNFKSTSGKFSRVLTFTQQQAPIQGSSDFKVKRSSFITWVWRNQQCRCRLKCQIRH